MKKTSLLLAIAGITFITLPSCKKQEQEQPQPPVAETVNASVKVNQVYSYTLPANEGPEPYAIVKQSDHSGTSVIEKNASGNFVYSYTPSANFTGTDVIVVSDDREAHGSCGHPDCNHPEHHPNKLFRHGNCQHHAKQKHIVTFNFTVENVTTVSTKSEMLSK